MVMAATEAASILERQARRWRLACIRVLAVAAVCIACLSYVGFFDAKRVGEGIPSLLGLFLESLPPDFQDAGHWVKPLVDTLAMSVAGTFLAVLVSMPLAFLGARNTAPHPVVYQAVRTLLNGLRSIPELIMGILFVAAVGFGALPGVLALGLHSVGMVGKFIAESVEHVEKEPIEAVKACGATPLQVIFHGTLPQILPQVADVSLYRWEYNFRASTVMGMVGAGGIGAELMGSLRIMQYREVSALLLIILVMVTVVDALGSYLRLRFR
jgi:phosphonate transport system permease protein